MIKHYICTVYRASQEYYSRENDKIVGTGQGYIILSNIYCDLSYFSIRNIENKELGIIIKDPINESYEQ